MAPSPVSVALIPPPLARALDLRPWQIAQVVRLRLIHHVKYPLAFSTPSV